MSNRRSSRDVVSLDLLRITFFGARPDETIAIAWCSTLLLPTLIAVVAELSRPLPDHTTAEIVVELKEGETLTPLLKRTVPLVDVPKIMSILRSSPKPSSIGPPKPLAI